MERQQPLHEPAGHGALSCSSGPGVAPLRTSAGCRRTPAARARFSPRCYAAQPGCEGPMREGMLPTEDVTMALRAVAQSQPGAVDELWELVYPWLVRWARPHANGRMVQEDGDARDLAHATFLELERRHLSVCTNWSGLRRAAISAMRHVACRHAGERLYPGIRWVPLTTWWGRMDFDGPLDITMALDELRSVNSGWYEAATLHLTSGMSLIEVGHVLQR